MIILTNQRQKVNLFVSFLDFSDADRQRECHLKLLETDGTFLCVIQGHSLYHNVCGSSLFVLQWSLI